MEAEIDSILKSVYGRDPRAIGVIAVDESGLCLGSKGNIPEEAAGLVLSVATHSSQVLPDATDADDSATPVVQIEAESLVIIVKKTRDVTVGIFRQA